MDEVAILGREAMARAAAIRVRCLRAASQDFPDGFPERFLKTLYRLAALLAGEAKAICDDPLLERLDKLIRCGFVLRFLREVGEWVRYAASAETANTPWSIIGPLKRLFEPLIPECQLLVRPKWHWNYEVLRGITGYLTHRVLACVEPRAGTEKELESLRSEIATWGEQCAIISFPYFDRKNVLRHVLFAHEIGHLIVDRYVPDYWEQKQQAIREFLTNKVLSQHHELGKPGSHPLLLGLQIDSANRCLRRGTEELLCDLCAVRVFGALAAFASYEVAVFQGIDIAPEQANFYPPWRLRLREMLDHCPGDWLQSLKLDDDERARGVQQKVLEAWRRLDGSATLPSNYEALSGPLASLVYPYLRETVLPGLVQHVFSFIDERIEAPVLDGKRLIGLLNRLNKDAPPSEVHERGSGLLDQSPASLREIFVTGWLHHLSRGDEAMFVSDDETYDKCNRLLLKAIESAELQKDYAAWKQTGA